MKAKGYRYVDWARINEPDEAGLERQRQEAFAYAPLISIAVPVYNTKPEYLREMVGSVRAQTYSNWELCLADGGSSREDVPRILKELALSDGRVKAIFLKENLGIAGNSNAAMEMAAGEYVALLDHDDVLAPSALYEVVKLLNSKPKTDFIYSDQDFLSEDGKERILPVFKPAWSPDLLRSANYISHLAVIRKSLLDDCGGFKTGFDGSQDYDLFLRLTEKDINIERIPKVLYHWRMGEGSTAANHINKGYAYEAGIRALTGHIERLGLKGKVESISPGFYRVNYDLPGEPLVSIIIPSKDHSDVLRRCLGSITAKSTYKNIEIIVAENNSSQKKTFACYKDLEKDARIKIIQYEGEFNYSRINNLAAARAEGEILLFLNNDTEVISPDWIERMLGFVQRKDVGAAGALLIYPYGLVQHAGVLVGYCGSAGHYHAHCLTSERGYYFRLIIAHNVSAVTGACMMVKRDTFFEAGGFDEQFAVALGDVDFCLKLREKDLSIVFTPDARLYHHEFKTRGHEDTPEKAIRFKEEVALLRSKWPGIFQDGDPYYSPNFSLTDGTFNIDVPGMRMPVMATINGILSHLPTVSRIYFPAMRRYQLYVRPRLIKLVDTIVWSPRWRTSIRFMYRKVFY